MGRAHARSSRRDEAREHARDDAGERVGRHIRRVIHAPRHHSTTRRGGSSEFVNARVMVAGCVQGLHCQPADWARRTTCSRTHERAGTTGAAPARHRFATHATPRRCLDRCRSRVRNFGSRARRREPCSGTRSAPDFLSSPPMIRLPVGCPTVFPLEAFAHDSGPRIDVP